MKVRTGIITIGAGAMLAGLAAGPALASTHTVQLGDTLSGIAAQSGVSVSRVEAANPQIKNPNVITVGELVNVPDGHSGTSSPTPAPAAPTPASTTPASTTPAPSTSGSAAPSSFQQCVAWRESSNTPTDPDGLYGILPSTWASLGYSGTAGEASVSQQNVAFNRLYAEYGTAPWAPYDGC
jgi:murein DD-endopeptidase MepM/ murein hydrolase activator NlpD